MNAEQANEIISSLKYGCLRHRFNEPGVLKEYTKKLMNLNYESMKSIVEDILEEDSKEVPAISVLLQRYKNIGKANANYEIQNEKYCAVCNDNGFVLLKEQVKTGIDSEGNNINSIYEFAYYCPFCAMGRQYEYDGRKCKEERSNYRMQSIAEVLPEEMIDEIRVKNLARKQLNEENRCERSVTKNQHNLQNVTANIGKDMPEAKYYWEDK